MWSVKRCNIIDFELPMTLGLYNHYDKDNIEYIFNWAPTEKQWWITGFNPEFDEPNSENMVLIGKINFAGYEEMYRGLQYAIENIDKYKMYKNRMIFDKEYTVWVIW